jgi:poly(3-hydroxybutyrate) depolymerase
MKKHFVSCYILILLSLSTSGSNLEKFTFDSWDKPDLDIFYHLPETVDKNTKILFIIHGNTRNADDYLKSWKKLTNGKNVALFAPQFSRNSFISFNTLQMSTSNGVIRTDTSLYLNDSIDTLFEHIKSKFNLKPHRYDIYGHSAGAQFVHRYLLMSEDPKVNIAVAANAGWYTFLNGANFPYGIKNPPIMLSDSNVKNFLNTKLHILIGSNDIDVDSSVNKSDGAQRQGLNRLQRAKNFFDYTSQIVKQNDLAFSWRYQLVPGAPHSNKVMSRAAVLIFFDSK